MKRIRKLTTAFLVIALLVTSLVSVPALAEDDDYVKVTRLAGASRYLTAVEVSKEAYEEADTVIIAAGADKNFPDALAASALAGAEDAPILLAEHDGFREGTLEEIKRLGAEKAIVLGGEVALSAAVDAALEEAGLEVERIAGANRYETAAMIAEEVLDKGKEVFLANGDEPWDALAIGPVAAKLGIPVLLTKAGALREETKAFLVDNGIKTVTILGGEKAVSAAVRAEIPAGISVKRVWGANREATAIEIAKVYFPDLFEEEEAVDKSVIIASREKFADALVGGYFGGLIDAPILLVYEKKIRENTDDFLFDLNPDEIYILGGEAVVSKAVADELDGYGVVKSVKAIAGQVLEVDDSLEFLVNGKWEMDATDFGKAFNGYTLSFLYATGITADTNGKATAVGKGKFAVEVSYTVGSTTVTIPAGGALAKDFVEFKVVALGDLARVTEFALYTGNGEEATKVGAVVIGDVVQDYYVKALKGVTVGGKVDTTGLPTFDAWKKSSNSNVIAIEDTGLALKGIGNTTLSFTFKGSDDVYNLVVKVNAGPRVATSLDNENVKVFTYEGKKFDFSDADEYGPIVLDQFGEEFTPDPVPYLVITKGKTFEAKGLASTLNEVALTEAGVYTVTAYTADPLDTPAGKKLGSYTVTTVVKAATDKPTFKLVFVDPLDADDPLGPRLTELDMNLLKPVEKLQVAIEAYIKGALLTEEDLAEVFADGDKFELTSSKPKVATVDFGTDGVLTLTEATIEALYATIDVVIADPALAGTTTLTLYTYDGSAKAVAATLNVTVKDTTPQVNTLNLKGSRLKVVVSGNTWELFDETQLSSPELAPYYLATPLDQKITEKVLSVTFYGGDFPEAKVTMLPAYGGKTFTFRAVLVPAS